MDHRKPPGTGYECWLGYDVHGVLVSEYAMFLAVIVAPCKNAPIKAAIDEIGRAFRSLSASNGIRVPRSRVTGRAGGFPHIFLAIADDTDAPISLTPDERAACVDGGFVVKRSVHDGAPCIAIVSGTPAGVLYGTFRLLRVLRTASDADGAGSLGSPIVEQPSHTLRILDH
jgi:alpha-glucuronidase